jgi:uncharacterized protein YdaU (DUF1376 family)
MGKYARDTGTLSLAQHGAYNLLLDYYYSTGPINAFEQCSSNAQLMPDHSPLYRLCKATTKPEQDAVDFVLKKYFVLKDDGFYHNDKCDQIIEEQTKKHENRVRAGSQAKLKQCSSNAPQTKTQTKTKNINPLPPKKVPSQQEEKKGGSGFYKDSGGRGGAAAPEGSFDIMRILTDAELLDAKQAAPGWDVYYHARVYNEGVNSGTRERPKYPGKAFAAWCKAYRKGQKP